MDNDQRVQAIAKRIKEARQDAGLSQDGLGKRLGLTKVGYGEYERGRRLFDTEQLFQLARILARPVEYFLGLDSELTADEGRALALYRQAATSGLGGVALRQLAALVADDT